MNDKVERRIFSTGIEVRAASDEDGSAVVRGHAALFETLSDNLGGFREKIAKGAFDDVLSDDTRALFNHDSNIILGRTTAGTLRVSVDDKGLVYEYDSPDTTTARDLLVSMERGDVTQSSFGFIVEEDDWQEDDEGRIIRTIIKLRELFDVSPVTYPAYPDTDVAVRSMSNFLEERGTPENRPDHELEILKCRTRLAEIGRSRSASPQG